MKLPFSIDRLYTTDLPKSQVTAELTIAVIDTKVSALSIDKFVTDISENRFVIGRSTYGLDGFTLERYPVIEGIYFSERPLTINILIKPSYFTIVFFSIFVFTFIPTAIFVDKLTINGVFKSPTVIERLLYSLGGIIPGLWCYFGYIRPIKKAENWIIQKLSLRITDKYVS